MHRRNLDELAVYELSEKTNNIKSDLLLDLYSEKISDTVYFTLEGKLCGIVCLHDLLNRVNESIVPINNKFSKMNCFDEKQARKIFSQNKFTKIPVVDGENHLLGDYSNLDDGDAIFIKWLIDWECVWMHLKKYIKDKAYKNIYVINPSEEKRYLKTYMKQIFETAKVNVTYINKREMDFILTPDERTLIVGADVEEVRCIRCRNAILSVRSNLRWEYMSFTGLWNRVAKYARNRKLIYYLEVKDPIIEKDILSELQDRGITILAIYNDAYYLSDYIKDLFQKNLYKKKIYGNNRFRPVESEAGKEFFGELLENEDYQNGIAQKDIEIGDSSLKNNYKSKYYNRVDGYRKTCYQPEHFWGTIYLFGPCLVRGWLLEDKYTMASQLQRKLNSEGYPYLVVNCGRPVEQSVCQELRKTEFHKGDIIIAYMGSYACETIESVEIRRFFEENKIPAGWCVDLPIHMNHKATGLMVELLYNKLKKYLTVENKEGKASREEIKVGAETGSHSLRELTQTVYLDRWFDDLLRGGGYQVTRGGILVDRSLDPFMLEHFLPRIFSLVEELIVFVAAEGNNIYTWKEYVSAILKLNFSWHKIKVVPGDTFVPYKPIFLSYYSDDELAKDTVLEEAHFFAECIAEPLNIKYRFGFQNTVNKKMMQYNQILKSELPKSGIQYIELK